MRVKISVQQIIFKLKSVSYQYHLDINGIDVDDSAPLNHISINLRSINYLKMTFKTDRSVISESRRDYIVNLQVITKLNPVPYHYQLDIMEA